MAKRLEEGKTDTSKKQHFLDHCSATFDDVMLLRKEGSKERFAYYIAFRHY